MATNRTVLCLLHCSYRNILPLLIFFKISEALLDLTWSAIALFFVPAMPAEPSAIHFLSGLDQIYTVYTCFLEPFLNLYFDLSRHPPTEAWTTRTTSLKGAYNIIEASKPKTGWQSAVQRTCKISTSWAHLIPIITKPQENFVFLSFTDLFSAHLPPPTHLYGPWQVGISKFRCTERLFWLLLHQPGHNNLTFFVTKNSLYSLHSCTVAAWRNLLPEREVEPKVVEECPGWCSKTFTQAFLRIDTG